MKAPMTGLLDEAWEAVASRLPNGWGVGIQPVVGGYTVGASPDTKWTVQATAYGSDALAVALIELAKELDKAEVPA